MPAARSRRRPTNAPKAAGASPAPEPPPVRGPFVYVAVSLLVLIPCFWQSRIQAGDLGSHIYNAWLVQLIRQGRAPGLAIVPQTTNILFDLMLSGLFRAFGPAAAQRITVSLAVLILVWGAFAFCGAAGRKPWALMPSIIALAYGWVFHMGFFNFYLSLGLCFWALALAWHPSPRRLAVAAALLLPAYLAHALPVAWTIALLGYLWLLRRWPDQRWRLLPAACAAMFVLHIALAFRMWTDWKPEQIQFTVGVHELWIFGHKYIYPVAATLLVWLLLAIALIRSRGRAIASSDLFQFCALTAAGIVLVPRGVWFPIYGHPLVYITQRMGLGLAVCLCALLSSTPARRWHMYALAAAALLFFGFLYVDERTLNDLEDQEDALVATLPPGQRVLSSLIAPPDVQTIPLAHLVDRACVGRCYSYGNYEPSSAQFRIRVTGDRGIVVPTEAESLQLQVGGYVARSQDLPLYEIVTDASGWLALRSIPAGALNSVMLWEGL